MVYPTKGGILKGTEGKRKELFILHIKSSTAFKELKRENCKE